MPIPQVTSDDVERVVRRDFPADQYETVMTILSEYGTEKKHQEPPRVQLAALKLANGSVERLRAWIRDAKIEFRDALVSAESPAWSKKSYGFEELSADEKNRIIDGDRRQYEEWLKRPV